MQRSVTETTDGPRVGRIIFGVVGSALALPFVVLAALTGYDLPRSAEEFGAEASICFVSLVIIIGIIWGVALLLPDEDRFDGPWGD